MIDTLGNWIIGLYHNSTVIGWAMVIGLILWLIKAIVKIINWRKY